MNRDTLKGLLIGRWEEVEPLVLKEMNDASIAEKTRALMKMVPKPSSIIEDLDQHVIGQDDLKKGLAVAATNHRKRIVQERSGHPIDLGKSSVLVIGPTGSGKTLCSRELAKSLGIPYVEADMTSFTPNGYVGQDTKEIFQRLLKAAKHDMKLAEKGIVYIDEIDKIARSSGSSNADSAEPRGQDMQAALLTLLEGTSISLRDTGNARTRNQSSRDFDEFDTSDVLFIVSGAFVGLDEIIAKRLGSQGQSIGFQSAANPLLKDKDWLLSQVQPEDLIAYGIMPELAGRLQTILTTKQLTRDDMVRILTEPKNAIITQEQTLMAMDDGPELIFRPKALEAIADLAFSHGTGARGLKAIVEDLLLETKFFAPDEPDLAKVIVTEETVLKGSQPLYMKADGTPYHVVENKQQASETSPGQRSHPVLRLVVSHDPTPDLLAS